MPAKNHQKQTGESLNKSAHGRKRSSSQQGKLPDATTQWSTRKVTDREWITPHVRRVIMRERTMLGQGERRYQVVFYDDRISDAEWLKAKTILQAAEEVLIQEQGSDPERYAVSVLTRLAQARTPRFGCGSMAKDQNFLALAAAIRATDAKNSQRQQAVGQEYFVDVLEPFGLNYREIDLWLERARKSLPSHHLPWSLSKGPVSWERVNNALKKHERHKSKAMIVYGGHDYAHMAELFWQYYKLMGDLDRAAKLLEQLSPSEFRRYKKRYEQIIADLPPNPHHGEYPPYVD